MAGLVKVEVPIGVSVSLGLPPVATQVEVSDSATLLDPSRTGTVYAVRHQELGETVAAQPGRGLFGLLDDLPAWSYEANACSTRAAQNTTCNM